MKTSAQLKAREAELLQAIKDAEGRQSNAKSCLADPDIIERDGAHEVIEDATLAIARFNRELVAIRDEIAIAERQESIDSYAKQCQNAASGELVWREEVAKLQDQAKAFVAQFEKTRSAGVSCVRAQPSEIAEVLRSEIPSLLCGSDELLRRTRMYLHVVSEGKFHAGKLTQSLWELQQGPDLLAIAQENLLRVKHLREQKVQAA